MVQSNIPAAAIKDLKGNNLLATYTLRFKTGTKLLPFFLFLFLSLSVVRGKWQALAANFGFGRLVWFAACA